MKNRNRYGVYDAPLWRDWLTWLTVVAVLAGFQYEHQQHGVGLDYLFAGLFQLALFGFLVGRIRLSMRKRADEQT